MNAVCLAAALLAATPTVETPAGNPASAADGAAQKPLGGRELVDATRDALRRWARPKDEEAEPAAREFLSLYEQLQSDEKLADSVREPLRLKVRRRLLALAEQIQKKRAAAKGDERTDAEAPASVDAPGESAKPLGQMGGFGGPGGANPFPGGGMRGAAAPRQGRGGDNGLDLVELIQQTVAPASWDVNGGPGSIYYWYGGHSLIIRQTQEVHGEISDVLDQLHRASH